MHRYIYIERDGVHTEMIVTDKDVEILVTSTGLDKTKTGIRNGT